MHNFATTTTVASEHGDLAVSVEWLTVAVVSVTVNACVLLRGILPRLVVVGRGKGHGSRKDCESEVGCQSTSKNDAHHGEEFATA